MGQHVEVNMNKLGRRKPIVLSRQQQLFVQVDCKDNMKVIEVSTQMSRHLNIMQIAKSSDNLDVKQSLLLQIQSINVSLFETSGDFMIRDPQTKDQKKR